EAVGAVGPVGGGQVTLEVGHITGLELGAHEGAGVFPVDEVAGPHHHIGVARRQGGVDTDDVGAMGAHELAHRAAQAVGRLGVHDHRFYVVDGYQRLDGRVLRLDTAVGRRGGVEMVVELLGELRLVGVVRAPEVGVAVGQYHADVVRRGGGRSAGYAGTDGQGKRG